MATIRVDNAGEALDLGGDLEEMLSKVCDIPAALREKD